MGIVVSKEEYTKRLLKACDELDIEFLGFVNGGKVIQTSKVVLRCKKDGTVWNTSSVHSTCGGSTGCPKCRVDLLVERSSVPDDKAVARFIATGKFTPGTTFTRNGRNSAGGAMWDVTCPICSSDMFVKAGLCDGVFRSSGGNLNKGWIPCRCKPSNILTEDQQRLKIQSIINKEKLNYKIIGWEGGEYLGANKGKVILSCEEHGEWPVGISHFVTKGSRCPSCTEFGFNKSASKSFVYVLEVAGRGGDFTGYGITGNFFERLQEHKRKLTKEGFEVLSTSIFKVDGESAVAIEGGVKKEFPLTPKEVSGFIREATHPHLYNNVVDFVQERAKIAWSEMLQQSETDNVDTPSAIAA